MEPGYYWAYHLMRNGERLEDSPSVVFVTYRGDVEIIGYDLSCCLSEFEIVGPVASYE